MFFRSVKYKVLIATLLTVFSTSFLFVYALFSHMVEERLSYIKVTTDLLVSHQARVSMMPMWEDDTFVLESILDALAETPYFVSAAFYNDRNVPLAALSKKTINVDMEVYRTTYPVLHPYENSGFPLGFIEVVVDIGQMTDFIETTTYDLAIVLVVILLLLTFFLYTLLHQFLTKPIVDLSKAFRKISEDENFVDIPKIKRDDEIGDLVLSAHILNAKRKEKLQKVNQEKDKAEIANKAKNSFLMRVSHELRTPLNGILGFLDILETHVDHHGKEYFDTVSKLSKKILQQVNEILDFSDIENHQIELIESTHKLNTVYKDITEKFLNDIDLNGNEVIFSADTRIPKKISVDLKRFEQIILHLVKNAIKFTKDGCINVHISVLKHHRKKVVLRVSVKDNGIGIDRSFQEKALEVFSQEDESSTRQYEGIGVGLSVTSSLLKLMGSRLQFESQKGEGSHFFFDITFKKEGEKDDLIPFEEDKRTVYVWDISKEWRQYIAEQIKVLGLTVETFDDLKDVQDQLKNARYSSAILIANPRYALDVVIPELEKISETFSNVHLIICQTSNWRVIKNNATLLKKPVTAWNLYKTLEETKSIHLEETKHTPIENPVSAKVSMPQHILIVEDDKVNQKLAQLMLENSDYTTDIAENGKEALDKILAKEYDLILMDIMMPVMDGLEATKKIREIAGKKSQIPIIAVTANAYKSDKDACFEVGMDGYISKPYNLKKLEQEIERVFLGHQ